MKLNKLLIQSRLSESKVITTGIDSLDKMIGGLRIGHICTVAARPAMGKTTFALTVAKNIGIMNKIPTAILSLEHNEDAVAKRLFAAEFGWKNIENKQTEVKSKMSNEMKKASSLLRSVGFTSSQMDREEYLQKMKEAPVWIEHALNITVDEVICLVERMKKYNGIKVLIIDGLAWLVTGMTYPEREQSMLKLVQVADRLKIAILLTSDLTRDVEHRIGCRPQLSDLRGGFGTEIFSSVVMFIYRPSYYGITEDILGDTEKIADIIVAKNNFGDVGDIRLSFSKQACFKDIATTSPIVDDTFEAFSDSLF